MTRSTPPAPVTLLTDFGWSDSYVGQVKGAILAVDSRIAVVDLGHDLAPGDIQTAAYLAEIGRTPFAPGTVHVCVVDPGVGGPRRALAGEVDGQLHVAPDNGVLSRVLRRARRFSLFEIVERAFMRSTPSPTFHGRDIFGPAAARLACGARPEQLGPVVNDPVLLPERRISDGDELRLGVVHVDRFGNAALDLRRDELAEWLQRVAGDDAHPFSACGDGWRVGRLARTFGDVSDPEAFLLFNSAEYLEIACNGASAARLLGLGTGDPVVLRPDPASSPPATTDVL